jgi:hypothetical protein
VMCGSKHRMKAGGEVAWGGTAVED